MATYSVTSAQVGRHGISMAASVVDTVEFAVDCEFVEVTQLTGSAPVYFTVDGTTPTVGGANTYSTLTTMAPVAVSPPSAFATAVKLISAATATVSVVKA